VQQEKGRKKKSTPMRKTLKKGQPKIRREKAGTQRALLTTKCLGRLLQNEGEEEKIVPC